MTCAVLIDVVILPLGAVAMFPFNNNVSELPKVLIIDYIYQEWPDSCKTIPKLVLV